MNSNCLKNLFISLESNGVENVTLYHQNFHGSDIKVVVNTHTKLCESKNRLYILTNEFKLKNVVSGKNYVPKLFPYNSCNVDAEYANIANDFLFEKHGTIVDKETLLYKIFKFINKIDDSDILYKAKNDCIMKLQLSNDIANYIEMFHVPKYKIKISDILNNKKRSI